MKQIYLILIYLSCIVHVVNAQPDQITLLSPDDPTFWLLKRFETKGDLSFSVGNTRPISRALVQKAVLDLEDAEQNGIIVLTTTEKELIRELRRHFITLDTEERHIFQWNDDENNIFANAIGNILVISQKETNQSDGTIIRVTAGGMIHGSLFNQKLGFYLRSTNTREERQGRDLDYQLGNAEDYGQKTYFDQTDAYLIMQPLHSPEGEVHLSVMVGKQSVSFGPGYRGQLVLSSPTESYPLIQFRLDWGRLHMTSFTGILKSDLVDSTHTYPVGNHTRTIYRKKYIAAHRFEFDLHRRFQIGIEETVIYGDRDLDIAYLTPIMFYRSYEHYLDNPDNIAIGIDFSWNFRNHWLLYGEFLIDDWYLEKITSDWWGNKLAYLGGIYWVNPLGINDHDLRFEFVQIEPWVYTHIYPINKYTHYNEMLGHEFGPSVRAFFLQNQHDLSWRWRVATTFEWIQAGEDGGDVDDFHDRNDDDSAHILDGIVEETFKIGLQTKYIIWRDLLTLQLGYEWQQINNRNHLDENDVTIQTFQMLIEGDW